MLTAQRVLDRARARRAQHARVAAAASQAALTAWARIDPAQITTSWLRLLVQPLAGLIAGQRLVARTAEQYVIDVLAEQGLDVAAAADLIPDAFSGTAGDGRALDSLLYQPAVKTLTLIGAGVDVDRALAFGAVDLDMIVRSEVADTARVSVGAAVVARPRVSYTRLLQPPSCSRCIVLAGVVYHWSAGFERHPRCDCIHVPVGDDIPDGLVGDPAAYFAALDPAEQDRVFTAAGAQAIRDGADIGRVVNARRGMSTAGASRVRVNADGQVVNERHRTLATRRVHGRDVYVTTEAVKGRARRGRPRVRLMPEQIYLDAGGDRDEAIRLLRLHGYLV